MEYRAHDLPVTGMEFASEQTGVALKGYDLLAGSADYKVTLLKSQGEAAVPGSSHAKCCILSGPQATLCSGALS